MDALSRPTLSSLEQIIGNAEECIVSIEQDIDKECLVIYNELGQKTIMNCRMNSVGATIRQICSHVSKRDIFSYEENYTIGM
jgi:hypothetical protein